MEQWRARLDAAVTALRCTRAEALALTVLLAGALAGLALVWWLARPGPPTGAEADVAAVDAPTQGPTPAPTGPGPAAEPDAFADAEPVVVHVAGAVADPGMVQVPAGSRVADALDAAGGAEAGADLGAVNLARIVADGEQIVVADADDPAATSRAGERINVNQADTAALEEVPGVGPVTAQRLISHRERHGPFRSAEDLLDVPGIGEATLEQLADHVRW